MFQWENTCFLVWKPSNSIKCLPVISRTEKTVPSEKPFMCWCFCSQLGKRSTRSNGADPVLVVNKSRNFPHVLKRGLRVPAFSVKPPTICNIAYCLCTLNLFRSLHCALQTCTWADLRNRSCWESHFLVLLLFRFEWLQSEQHWAGRQHSQPLSLRSCLERRCQHFYHVCFHCGKATSASPEHVLRSSQIRVWLLQGCKDDGQKWRGYDLWRGLRLT